MYKTIAKFQSENQHLCLDKWEEENNYRLAWRGTSISENGFINRPAEFSLNTLAVLLKEANDNGEISDAQYAQFKSIL